MVCYMSRATLWMSGLAMLQLAQWLEWMPDELIVQRIRQIPDERQANANDCLRL